MDAVRAVGRGWAVSDWATERGSIVGGSEVVALFPGEDGFVSEYELFHAKRGELDRPAIGDDVIWGSLLEPSIIEGTRQVLGWDSTPWAAVAPGSLALPDGVTYVQTDRGMLLKHVSGLGGTPDGIVRRDFQLWLLEIKIASLWALADWPGEKDAKELPTAYLLQVWTYLGLLGLARALVAVFVLEQRKLLTFEVEAHPAMFGLICERVREFWARVAANDEPDPDPTRDADAVARRFRAAIRAGTQDRSGDAAFCDLVAEYRAAREVRLIAEKREEARKTLLLHRIGDAERVIAGPLVVSATGGRLSVKETRR